MDALRWGTPWIGLPVEVSWDYFQGERSPNGLAGSALGSASVIATSGVFTGADIFAAGEGSGAVLGGEVGAVAGGGLLDAVSVPVGIAVGFGISYGISYVEASTASP